MKRLFRRLGLMGLGCVLSLLACELGLRLFTEKPSLRREHYLTMDGMFRRDPNLIMAFPWHQTDEYYRLKKGEDKVIVALGDSFTQGHPGPVSESYPAVLERMLSNTRVLNLGVGDSGPDRQLALFTREVLPRVKPSAVVWTLYTNDLTDNWDMPVYDIEVGKLVPRSGRSNWVYRRSQVMDFLPRPRRIFLHSYLVRRILKATESIDRGIPPRYGADGESWAADKFRLEIGEMERLSRLHGFTLYFVNIAPQSMYANGAVPHPTYKKIEELIKDKPHFVDARFDDGANLFCDGTQDPNEFGARHFNAAGYKRLAELIGQSIQSGGSAPGTR